ncbi:GtrA family protein [Paraburkholderia aspalathi]|uniref:GtrA family protein n=1 Tax=Paraburkholderia aspalathi TaxID=1324617 RepID=UPI0038BA22D1
MIGREFARFSIAGVIGFAVDAGVLYLALACGLGLFTGRVVSFIAAVWVTWRINRRHTFRERAARSAWVEWWRYLLSMLGGASVNYAAYSAVVLTVHGGRLVPLIAVACGSVAGLFVNFFSAKHWAFKK